MSEFAPEVETPVEETVAPPEAPPAPNLAAMDALVDGDDVDEGLKGKPVAEVLRLAKQWKGEAKTAAGRNSEFNALKSRAEIAERMLATMRPQEPAPRQDDPQAFLQRFANAPTQVLPEVINQTVAPLYQRLEQLQSESLFSASELARDRARLAVNVDAETWETLKRPLAAIMQATQKDPRDPQSWVEAADVFKAVGPKLFGRTVATPTPAAPPVGQARSAGAQASNRPRLKAQDERQLAELAEIAGIKKGTPAWDRLVKDITNDPQAMGGFE